MTGFKTRPAVAGGGAGRQAYGRVVEAFKGRRQGATVADIAAGTGLPLTTVRELAPRAADEFSGRLQVTESGEILYSFPRGFTSRYHGAGPTLRRLGAAFARGLAAVGKTLFKVWIMVMLVGYFVLFMALAVASLFVSVAASASGSDNRSRRSNGAGGFFIAAHLFDLILRLWFYSELTRAIDPSYHGGRPAPRPKGRPLHHAIFSFVFGDGDPNANWAETERQIVIAALRGRRGVISLPELMALTGLPPDQAEEAATAFCVEFNGSPEATEDGTVVYRFDEILRQSGPVQDAAPRMKALKKFSGNKAAMNAWFAVINGVNLVFGGYFLYHALTLGALSVPVRLVRDSGFLYRVAYGLLSMAGDPLALVTVGLGIAPLVFSALFWIIPAVRRFLLARENASIKMENYRRFAFGRIWGDPAAVKPGDLTPPGGAASLPPRLPQAQAQVIREMGTYSQPDVQVTDQGEVYSFPELQREKAALQTYRDGINPGDAALGATVFDSE